MNCRINHSCFTEKGIHLRSDKRPYKADAVKIKILNSLLIITSLFGYLEWGAGNRSFLFQTEYEVFRKMFSNPEHVAHPFVLLPLLGQLLLLFTWFQKKPAKVLTYLGIGCLSLLLGLMFFIGIWEMNFKILFSTLPFLTVAVYTLIHSRKRRS